MGLQEYHRKRDFGETPEPSGEETTSDPTRLSFVIQRHDARRLHYDFRLELDGVLLSWAVPKGPSLDPGVKRLAMRTEDHPLDYGDFEGVIPRGQYGGGSVLVWDRGVWRPDGDPAAMLRKGHLKFDLEGERLRGRWNLVRTGGGEKESWLLIKQDDEHALRGDGDGVTERYLTSVSSGREQTEVAEDRARIWTRAGELPGRDEILALEGVHVGPVPWPPEPQLPIRGARPVDDPGWVHEISLQGYRILARLAAGTCRLASRAGVDVTERFRGIARAIELGLPVDAVLDGEIVYLDADGRSDFAALQRTLGRDDPHLFYVVFDLLRLGDVDVRGLPLLRRKELLGRLVPPQGRIRLGAHVEARGTDVLARATELGVEGIVSKRADAPYTSGRNGDWVEVRCRGREEFVVVGFLARGSPVSCLLLAQRDGDALAYVGRVGAWPSEEARAALRDRLAPLERDTPSADARDAAPHDARWVEPRLLADVRYAGWTSEGELRQTELTRIIAPLPVTPTSRTAKVTNADRVLFPDDGVTKGQVAAYYARFAELVLRQVARRPLTLVRCPTGIGSCFHQKHKHHLPKSVHAVDVGEEAPYVWVDDAEGLLALIQNGAVELHPWGSTIDDLERPDRLILDLDPDDTLPWEVVVHAAHELRALLDELGLASFPKLTGGKGLHVVVPVRPTLDWERIKAFTRDLAEEMVRRAPTRYTSNLAKERRVGRVFVDYLRNQRDATAVAAWSTRARPGARVAIPILWRDLHADAPLSAPRLDRAELPAVDPWGDLDEVEQEITPEMLKRVAPRS